MVRRRIKYFIEPGKPKMCMMETQATLMDLLNRIKEINHRPDLNQIFLAGGDQLPLNARIESYDTEVEFYAFSSDTPADISPMAPQLPHTQAPSSPVTIYTTIDYKSMVKGDDFRIQMDWDLEHLTKFIMPEIQRKTSTRTPLMLHVFLPGGIPFTKGNLNQFLESSPGTVRHVLYIVVTRRIPEDFLNATYHELCDCSTEAMRLLLAPFLPQTEIGLTHIACLLGYLRHENRDGDKFLRALACYTLFPPLICNMFRIMDSSMSISGRNIVAVTASLLCFYKHLLDSIVPSDRLFEYVLHCSCFVREQNAHIGNSLPIKTYKTGDATGICQAVNQEFPLVVWQPDLEQSDRVEPLEIHGSESILYVFSTCKSFRPIPGLALVVVDRVVIARGDDERTLLYLSKADSESSREVVVTDPMTGCTTTRNLSQLSEKSPTMDRIDEDKVSQVVFVCLDESGSMLENLQGELCKEGEYDKLTIAVKYLNVFASRLSHADSILGLISFNHRITIRSALSSRVSDFEEGLKCVTPNSTSHLWDAIDTAADQLISYALPDKKRFPNADLRILVLSDGDDMVSSQTPWDLCKKLCQARIRVDSVVLAPEDFCKDLGALCQMTGGMSFRPSTMEEGLALFEQESFLFLGRRKKRHRHRGPFDKDALAARSGELVFDVTAPAATPRHDV